MRHCHTHTVMVLHKGSNFSAAIAAQEGDTSAPEACPGWGQRNYSSYYVFESTSIVVPEDTGC